MITKHHSQSQTKTSKDKGKETAHMYVIESARPASLTPKMARCSEEEIPAFPYQNFFTTAVEKDIIAPKYNSVRSPGP